MFLRAPKPAELGPSQPSTTVTCLQDRLALLCRALRFSIHIIQGPSIHFHTGFTQETSQFKDKMTGEF